MGAEDEKLEGQESSKGTPPADGQEGAAGTGQAADGQSSEGKGGEDVKDSHGQPGINKERHDKEMAEKDARIAELEAQVREAAETKEGREKLEKQIAELKEAQETERVTHKLELAGCKSVKAAKALLEDFGGDVAKLKSEHPYLFEEAKGGSGSTGLKPGGAPSGPAKTISEGLKHRKD